jgi:DNA-binding winged helix-turn-helix (wHTH) protein/predicted ATPase
MPPDVPLQFGPYTLASPQGPLCRATEVVPLPPKALAVLWQLASQAGQVVRKAALLEAVWADTAVSEGVLTVCLAILRRALGDDARQPRYIATVHRLGYRFVAPVTAGAAPPPQTPAAPPFPRATPAPQLVGRAAEVAQLHTCFAQAQQGLRQIVWVTGEAGVGKTTLVDAVVPQLAAAAGLRLGRGQCIEHYGVGEAYLPLLEALGRLGRAPGGELLVACLRQYAPTWLAHLPALCPPEVRAAVQRQGQGATQARMLRELAEALEVLAAEQPLVLVLEDLHWSDPSTVEALALLARRREAARLLVLGTYRPVDLLLHDHPLKRVKQELVAHGLCVEVPLGGLSPQAVATYVAQRRGALAGHEELAAWVYQRTEGHPLFMMQVVDELAQQHLLQGAALPAADRPGDPALDLVVPQGLQALLAAQLGRLDAPAQQVLEVGSVAGAEFAVASVVAGLHMAPEAVEAVCEALARQGQFLEERGLIAWPDGTVSGCYGFRHVLYQEVVYQQMSAGRRMRCHQAIGVRLEAGYGGQVAAIAAALAMHFERGRDYRRAVQYLSQAADTAAQRHAPYEVIALLTRAVALLALLPETAARTQQELALQLALGPALLATKGQGALEVEQTYSRARALYAQGGALPQRLATLWGLCRFYQSRGLFQRAQEVGDQLARLAQGAADPLHRLMAHEAVGTTLFYCGEYAAARTSLEQGIALIDPMVERHQALHHGVAPGVRCLLHAALTLWCLGYPAQALQRSQEAQALAQALAHPYMLALVQLAAAWLHYCRRDVPAVQAHAEALLALATTQGAPFWVGFGTSWRGWALAMQGQGEVGQALMRQGVATIGALEQELARLRGLVLLAEATGQGGQVAEGLRLLAEARTGLEAMGSGDLLVEVYRLQGEFRLRQAVPDAAQAVACFQQALDLTRRQQAKSWELRAAVSLSRLWQQHGKRHEARQLLGEVYGWFTEGFDTADLQEAKALLQALEA